MGDCGQMCSSKESQFDHLVEVEKRRWGRDVRLVLCNQQGRNPPGEGTNLTTSGPPWLWLVNSGQYLTKLVIIGQESPNILGSANLTKSSLREKDITLPKRGCSFVWTRVIKSHIDHIDQLSQWLSDHYFSATFSLSFHLLLLWYEGDIKVIGGSSLRLAPKIPDLTFSQ